MREKIGLNDVEMPHHYWHVGDYAWGIRACLQLHSFLIVTRCIPGPWAEFKETFVHVQTRYLFSRQWQLKLWDLSPWHHRLHHIFHCESNIAHRHFFLYLCRLVGLAILSLSWQSHLPSSTNERRVSIMYRQELPKDNHGKIWSAEGKVFSK